ncbi:hypothetical protein K504DRAFT_480055 [Pleomassaria siparia CBS 279.74]|uniref:Non-structural maintenance of chromosomes element 1 homolog n=1 Tax=Pleomassaria siparia CBS 279.74 TaxID=1314801 RepID=A0A6G1KHW3_9PLEO|nr:hypothetical protein K504DRAFT_480055 [Pleomassaria siparia CBS 279.74]
MSRDDGFDLRAESPDQGRYNNAHRAFLQAFLSRSVMTADEIKPVLAAVMTAKNPNRPLLEGDITSPDISTMIQMINQRLTSLDYEIRSMRDQQTKTLIYALVNTTSDPLTQLATTFSPDEIAYIKRLLDAMFETYNSGSKEIMAVSSMQASQLAKAPARNRQSQIQSQVVNGDAEEGHEPGQTQEASVKSVTLNDAAQLLDRLAEQHLFTKSSRNYWSLAPRGLMELRSYLKETYNDAGDPENEIEEIKRIKDCEGCKDIVTVGLRCSRRECGIRWHDGCARQYFAALRADGRKCPGCGQAWVGDSFIGERVITGAGRASGSGAGAAGRSNGRREVVQEEEDEEEMDHDDDDDDDE